MDLKKIKAIKTPQLEYHWSISTAFSWAEFDLKEIRFKWVSLYLTHLVVLYLFVQLLSLLPCKTYNMENDFYYCLADTGMKWTLDA